MTAVAGDLPPSSWNDTSRPFRLDETVPGLLRAAARRHPDRPALVGVDGSVVTHAELDRRTNQLAHLLRGLGVGRGGYVALYAERTLESVAALVAVVKSGAAYVPIDPAWPRRRVLGLLADLDVCCVVAGRAQLRDVQEFRWEAPCLRHVLCPEISTAETWTESLDRGTVERFFDFLCGQPDPLAAAGFNLRRTCHVYTLADVAAYRDHAARLVLGEVGHGAAILEVGCGSGELVTALAPSAGRYVAVDPSEVAVDKSRTAAARAGAHIEGIVRYAHEVHQAVTGAFDAVVLASTVQFLPDMSYLLEALRSLVGLVRRGGAVLLVDLIDPACERHAGLRVPPALIGRLTQLVPGVAEVEIRYRPDGVFTGELATRYDAVLRIGEPPEPEAVARAADRARVWTGAHLTALPCDAPADPPRAEDVAYTIFTSGSTGSPKGVVVAHRSVVNLIDWVNRTFRIGPADRVLCVASFCFDLSVYDVFGVLAGGGSVRVATEAELAEPEVLVDILETEPITLWDSAPAALAMVTPFLAIRAPLGRDSLRLVLLSGDWVPVSLPDEIRAAFPRVTVVALGGATECTVWSNHYPVGAVNPAWPSIPYGRPIQNARYYVLDAGLLPCPVGEAGDLYIAGDCVALGYARSPGLTAGKFLPDPWAPRPGERMYRTGDRARWLTDGNLEFLGRLDDQVKVRGYRIELGEVRGALAQCPHVRAAVVVAVDGPGGKDLAAFYVPAAASVPATEIRTFLAAVLPAHMIPSRIIAVESFPLSSTGKVDRSALLLRL